MSALGRCTYFTDHFSGPGKTIGPVCISVHVRKLTCALNDLT